VGTSVSRLPVSLRILVESVLRQLDGRLVRDEDVEALVQCQPDAARTAEVPFVVVRVLLQDFTGVPLLVDLAYIGRRSESDGATDRLREDGPGSQGSNDGALVDVLFGVQ
jgi:aconitate hydratase